MKYTKWTMEDTERLLDAIGGEEIGHKIAQHIVEVIIKTISFITATYTVPVDYSRSINDSVKAGNYNWSNSNVNDRNFPSTETGTADVSMAIFHFDTAISSENAIEKMKQEGYRPATIKEILAFGEKNPEVQREFPIVALGSVCELGVGRRVPYFVENDSRRELGLDCFDLAWLGSCRFLGVRN